MEYKSSLYNFEFKDSQNGNCVYNCYNEKYIKLGKYVFEDLLDKSTSELKELLHQRGYISDANDIITMKKNFEEIKRKKHTFSLVVSLTEDCNFACTYCYQDEKNEVIRKNNRMSESKQSSLIRFIEDKMKTYKQLHICWFGGEPLLEIESIKKLTAKIESMALENNCLVSYEMISNGYLLSTEVIEFFSHVNLKRIQITFDGAEDIHNKYRILKNHKGSFKTILKNVKEASLLIHITIRINVQKDNVESVKNLIYLLKQNDLSNKVGIYFAPIENFSDNLCNTDNNILSYEEFSKSWIVI